MPSQLVPSDDSVIERLNAFVGSINDREYLVPEKAVNELRQKLMRIGLHFEDVEFSIKHYKKEGKILRFNRIGLKTKYYHPKGGIVEQKGGIMQREEEAWNNATYLLGIYPENVSLYLKADGKLNIRLKN